MARPENPGLWGDWPISTTNSDMDEVAYGITFGLQVWEFPKDGDFLTMWGEYGKTNKPRKFGAETLPYGYRPFKIEIKLNRVIFRTMPFDWEKIKDKLKDTDLFYSFIIARQDLSVVNIKDLFLYQIGEDNSKFYSKNNSSCYCLIQELDEGMFKIELINNEKVDMFFKEQGESKLFADPLYVWTEKEQK
jgi:hypothetical protein